MTDTNDSPSTRSNGRGFAGDFFDQCAVRGAMMAWLPSEEMALEALIPQWEVKPGHRVLEAGCGTGRLTGTLARLVGCDGEVVACDESAEMLRHLLARGLPRSVRPLCASASATGAADGHFHRIICLNAFPHFANPRGVLAEFRRTIRSDGLLCIAHCWDRTAVNRYHRSCHPAVARHRLPTERDMRRLLRTASFEVSRLTDGGHGYCLCAVPELDDRRGRRRP
jgi:ubiquinone/menaquinone biosynthesis C-methylase UbiE